MNLKEAATKLNEQLFDIRYYKPEERVEIIEKALSEALKAGMIVMRHAMIDHKGSAAEFVAKGLEGKNG